MSIYDQDFPNLLLEALDPDVDIPLSFDMVGIVKDPGAEIRRWEWCFNSTRDYLASCVGHGEATADAIEALIWDLPPGPHRTFFFSRAAQYRRAERKMMEYEQGSRGPFLD